MDKKYFRVTRLSVICRLQQWFQPKLLAIMLVIPVRYINQWRLCFFYHPVKVNFLRKCLESCGEVSLLKKAINIFLESGEVGLDGIRIKKIEIDFGRYHCRACQTE